MSEAGVLKSSLFIVSVVVNLGFITAPAMAAANEDAYLVEAAAHAEKAVTNGKQGNADALVVRAEAALQQAELARKNMKHNSHLEEIIKGLKDAIVQAKAGHTEKATVAAEEALAHLTAIK